MKKSSSELSFDELDALNRVPINDAVDALDQIQRRRLLFELLAHDLPDESPGVLAESDDESGIIEHDVEMNSVHLPKLVDYGFIDWNRDTHEVGRGANFDKIKPLLELLEDHEDEFPKNWS